MVDGGHLVDCLNRRFHRLVFGLDRLKISEIVNRRLFRGFCHGFGRFLESLFFPFRCRILDQLFDRRTKSLIALYRKRLAGKSLGEKWQELARIRAEEGYMARVEGKGLTEHHCPIAAIAKEFPQVCKFEKRLFEAVLGGPLDRTDHMASGGRACVYVPDAPKKR